MRVTDSLGYRGHGWSPAHESTFRLEVNTNLLAVDRNIVDGLQIGHSVEEDVSLWAWFPGSEPSPGSWKT